MSDATGSSTYQYDPFGELTSTTKGAGQTTGYGYNYDGDVTSITYPLPTGATWATSATITYTHDNADYLASVTDFNGNLTTIANSADGLPDHVVLGASGDKIDTTYDNTDAPSLIKLQNSTTTLQSFSYSDGPAGNILSETETPASSQSPADYTYDAQGRVTSMTPGSGSTLSYGYDPSGNLTSLPNGATGSYDNAGELTSAALSSTTTNYGYNADGQRLTANQGSTTIASATWNSAAQLTAYDDASANMTAATYDGNGLRATATTGTATQNFTWDIASGMPQLLMDSNSAYIYVAGTAPTEQVNLTTGAITYLVADSLGSVRGTVTSSGSLAATTSYDAWGNPQTTGGLSGSTPFGYAGGYTDSTGLIYLINRYYDPATGQFISVDRDLAQTLQPYSYADADPVDQADPYGLYAVLYHDQCAVHICINITKRCGSDNKCGLYFGWKFQGRYRRGKHVKWLYILWIGGTVVEPHCAQPWGCWFAPKGNSPGTKVYYGEWGFHIKGHDWGYYCSDSLDCSHMGPSTGVSFSTHGYIWLNGVKTSFAHEAQWSGHGKKRPWRNSYKHPAL